MKTTAMGVILDPTEEQKCFLDDLMARYCAAVRWAFNRLLDGWETQDTREAVQAKFTLNSRQANDAVHDAQATISSQRELVKLNHANAQKRVEFTQKRLDKAKSPAKRARLQRRLEKEQRKVTRWQRHIDAGTIPTVIFGTKELFIQRCKGNISREEWRDARSNRYASRGDKEKGGNLNTRIVVINGQTYLEIAAEAVQKGKTVRYNRVTVPIYIAHKPSKKTGRINGLNYRKMVLDYLKTGNTYQVEILRRNGRYYVHITIDEEVPAPYNAHGGVVGVDTNPDGLGISRADYLGQFRESIWLPQGEWTYARSNRRMNLIGEAAALVVEMAVTFECALSVEDLAFKDDKSVSVKFNRMSHGFVWSTFLKTIERTAARKGVPFTKEKPPFSSVIGILKYQQQYGLSNHEAAGYVLAKRGLGIDAEAVPKPLVVRFIKNVEGFQFLNNWKQWSAIKKAAIATIKKITGKEVKSLVSWQHHRKNVLKAG